MLACIGHHCKKKSWVGEDGEFIVSAIELRLQLRSSYYCSTAIDKIVGMLTQHFIFGQIDCTRSILSFEYCLKVE